ncbi:IS1 family transposase [Taibaiella helva]|uniref:IS1 family transposase n=1 Tax=Taibaiella helva TaxID=2301235 RepID=UPI0013003672
MKCKYCSQECIRKGLRNGIQQFYCKACRKYQRHCYKRAPVSKEKKLQLIQLHKEGMGVQSIGRILHISASSVVRQIFSIAANTPKRNIDEQNQAYEIDEMQTYVGRNNQSNYVWITYAINRQTKEVIDFVVGRRTKENLNIIVEKILTLRPRRIYTDGLNIYRGLIHKSIHSVQRYKINRIERKNLTLRTHLKRLNRETICFSKSITMLHACLMLYFFG